MPTTLDDTLLRDLYGTDAMREVFDSAQLVQRWLDAEAALALALADAGVIPADAAAAIAAACRVERYDLDVLREGIADSQHPLVPLIRALAIESGPAGAWAHWGATTQDIIDTGLVLQVRDALALLAGDLARALTSIARLAEQHRSTAMAGRTHGQHAVPITFGAKAASWGDELLHAHALVVAARASLAGQLSGAAGTLASLGPAAAEVLEGYCGRLGLVVPEVSWHVARAPLRGIAYALLEIGATGERIAAEIVRLQATEVAELREPAMPGHVGSSTMPQKQNPMTSEYLIASARLLRASAGVLFDGGAHAGERDMGAWATEWIALPQACILASSVADKLAWVVDGLIVDAARMQENLELTRGGVVAEELMMRLGRELGHEAAHELVGRAARRRAAAGSSLDEELAREGSPAGSIAPEDYVGWSAESAQATADRIRAYLGVPG
jgi:3-carboxy-cis,cis-muconate cycloisomerase